MFHPSGPARLGISTKSSDTDNSASVYVVEVFAGETAILPCPPPPSDPPATITFYKNGLVVPENGKLNLKSVLKDLITNKTNKRTNNLNLINLFKCLQNGFGCWNLAICT